MQLALDRGIALEGSSRYYFQFSASQAAAANLCRSLGFEFIGREPRPVKIGDRLIDEEYFILYPINSVSSPEPHFKRLKQEKRPRLFSPGRLGSPPPELPNHEIDRRFYRPECKRHFGNGISAKLISTRNDIAGVSEGIPGPLDDSESLIAFARSARRPR